MLVENGNDGDIRVKIESGGFDIDECALVPMLVEKPPTVHWFEPFDEERNVVSGIRLPAVDGSLVDGLPEGVPCIQTGWREWADVRKMREGLPERRYVWKGIGHVSFIADIPLSNVMVS